MNLYTIGFTKKSAERFFALIRENGVKLVIDVRLRPDTQLSGFAKRSDLGYFLRELSDCDYQHRPLLAPTGEILDDYRRDHDQRAWGERFIALMDERAIPQAADIEMISSSPCCLLCSEDDATQCHRSFVAQRMADRIPGLRVVHLQ